MTLGTWRLRDRGRDLTVEVQVGDRRNHARLLVDGEEVAAGDCDAIGDVDLRTDDLHVKVAFWWRGRVGSCDLLEGGTPDDALPVGKLLTTKVPFTPPPGTRAARTHAWREAHPGLWAARHVAIKVGSILLVVLGVSALVGALVDRLIPAIDWNWVPTVHVPGWLEYLNPSYWIGRLLPDWDWFGWVPDVDVPEVGWLKYVVILAIAVATGVRELRKRRERVEREAAHDPPDAAEDAPSGDAPGDSMNP